MLPLFALALPILVLFCGLLIDVGIMENQVLAMQNAADAACLGVELDMERGSSSFVQTGRQIASLNGFAQGNAGTSVTVRQGPTTGSYSGEYDALEVDISQSVKTYFLQYLTASSVAVRSVALIPPCVFLAGSSSNPGIPTFLAAQSVVSFACPAYINGLLYTDDSSSLRATAWNTTSFGVVNSSSFSPKPHTSAPTLRDPLAALAQPVAGSCDQSQFSQSGGSAQLYPGTYCKGLSLSNTTVTLAPGRYTITGGAHWHNAQVRGTGVTLFFTQGGGASFGQVIIDGNSNIDLIAPADSEAGGVPGVLLFIDRQWAPTSSYDLQIVSSHVQADGVVYAPQAGLLLSSSSLRPAKYLALDLPTLSLVSSQISTNGDFSSVTTDTPFRSLGGNVE